MLESFLTLMKDKLFLNKFTDQRNGKNNKKNGIKIVERIQEEQIC